ncbi:MAG: hypothetical protein N5P05_002184 [Chroococcopsis gigantea SAG 12.99]|jgi:hypothetical protein|nr:hypothetical protein [Chlorogloea purpurea SAG 13.99]MDV3000578.1 hypothetical protein [Chroococcopsis gigantea SAG 12.99]
MDDWQKDFWRTVESLGENVEVFLQDVEQTIERIGTEVIQDVGETFHTVFGSSDEWESFLENPPFLNELEEFFTDVFTPTDADGSSGFDFYPDNFINPKVNPSPGFHPACVGCSYYHGRIYEGSLLVCAMHPYGWEGDSCPDSSLNSSN